MQFIVTRTISGANRIRFLAPDDKPQLLVSVYGRMVTRIHRNADGCKVRNTPEVVNAHLHKSTRQPLAAVFRMGVDADDVGDMGSIADIGIGATLSYNISVRGKRTENPVGATIEIPAFNERWARFQSMLIVGSKR